MKGNIFNTRQLRETNERLLRTALRTVESDTIAGLSARTGLSVATCGKILPELVESGEALELEMIKSDSGRPPRLFAYNPMFSVTAMVFPKSLDGEKHLVFKVRDAKGQILAKECRPVDRADAKAIKDVLRELSKKYPSLKSVAFAIPGLVKDGGIGFCDLPELEGVDLAGEIDAEFDVAVSMDNDMNMAAYGYFQEHLGQGSVVYLAVPRKHCVGAGIVVEGMIVRGHTRFAGELSFAPFAETRDMQFAGMSPEAALEYTAKVAATVIATVNPSIMVIASELMTAESMADIAAFCRTRIPEEHLPEFVSRASMDDDCLSGLATMAAASLP